MVKSRQELEARYQDYSAEELAVTLSGLESGIPNNEAALQRLQRFGRGDRESAQSLQASIDQEQIELGIVKARLAE